MFDVTTLEEIRIIVNKGRGCGNQRACLTAMLYLRELGFKGTFDVRYHEKYPSRGDGHELKMQVGAIGRILTTLIPEFEPDENYERPDPGVAIHSPVLGKLRITRLTLPPHNLPHATLTVTGADDFALCLTDKKCIEAYNTQYYIGLKPTDWYMGYGFVKIKGDNTVYPLPKNGRLSSPKPIAAQLPHCNIQAHERTLLDLLNRLSQMPDALTQLVYGLYPSHTQSLFNNRMEPTGNLEEIILVERLVQAHTLLMKNNPNRSSILLFPQHLNFLTSHVWRREILPKSAETDLVICPSVDDLPNELHPKTVYLVHTGKLQPAVFDHIMLQATRLPPVIEGCNSIEACESAGRLYLHGSARHHKINRYVRHTHAIALENHLKANDPLENGKERHVSFLVSFMEEALEGKLSDYMHARQAAHLKRPDALRGALEKLNAIENGHKHHRSSEGSKQRRRSVVYPHSSKSSQVTTRPIKHHTTENVTKSASLADSPYRLYLDVKRLNLTSRHYCIKERSGQENVKTAPREVRTLKR